MILLERNDRLERPDRKRPIQIMRVKNRLIQIERILNVLEQIAEALLQRLQDVSRPEHVYQRAALSPDAP